LSNVLDLSGDVSAAGAALAGLLLVYVGGISTAYSAFRPEDQPVVRSAHLRRAWVGVIGFLFALTASALALMAKGTGNACIEYASLALLLMGFVSTAITAFWTVLDI
jgi:hypothetical protein